MKEERKHICLPYLDALNVAQQAACLVFLFIPDFSRRCRMSSIRGSRLMRMLSERPRSTRRAWRSRGMFGGFSIVARELRGKCC